MIKFNGMFTILGLLIIVPLIVIICIYLLAIKKEKKNNIQFYKFKRDFWSSVISVIYGSIIFSLSLAYAVNVIKSMYKNSLQDKYMWLIICICILVLLTFIFFLFVFAKYIKIVSNKDKYFVSGDNNA